jgi:FMN-dependent NADH-azoreductase
MAKLLHIVASPRPEAWSTRVAKAFLEAYCRVQPGDRIETLDLFADDAIPPFTAPAAKAKYAVLAGQTPRFAAEAAWKPVIDAINHFTSFDRYVISSPMWNFNIPYRLKQYIDVIVQPGLTFKSEPGKGHTGLVTGKPVMLVLARGGSYGPGDPTQTFDYQESYLRSILGFIGFTDIRSVRIQGTLEHPREQVEADMQKAIAEATEAVAAFAGIAAVGAGKRS